METQIKIRLEKRLCKRRALVLVSFEFYHCIVPSVRMWEKSPCMHRNQMGKKKQKKLSRTCQVDVLLWTSGETTTRRPSL